MTIDKREALKQYSKMKSLAFKYYSQGNYEATANYITAAAFYMWKFNVKFVDDDFEKLIVKLSKKLLSWKSTRNNHLNNKKVIFFDTIGRDIRGLGYIYVQSLLKLNYGIYYITYTCYRNHFTPIENLIKNDKNSKIFYISDKSVCGAVVEAERIINELDAPTAFIYTQQHDVIPMVVFAKYSGKINRYLINMGDHAFWLGKSAIDYCIEYRDFGGMISREKRGLGEQQIIKLPFFPNDISEFQYQGLPFDLTGKQLVLSGGGIYKTLDSANTFYHIIRQILDRNPDSIFLMLSNNTCPPLKQLLKDYPNRTYHLNERKDLKHVMKKCVFYLSTYPIGGGLMFQYAAREGKLPLTLKNPGMPNGFLLDSEKLNYEFNTIEELLAEADHLIQDPEYRKAREKDLPNHLIDPDTFCIQLDKIIKEQRTDYSFEETTFNTKEFYKTFLKNMSLSEYSLAFIGSGPIRHIWYMFLHFPFLVLCGCIVKAKDLLRRRINRYIENIRIK